MTTDTNKYWWQQTKLVHNNKEENRPISKAVQDGRRNYECKGLSNEQLMYRVHDAMRFEQAAKELQRDRTRQQMQLSWNHLMKSKLVNNPHFS